MLFSFTICKNAVKRNELQNRLFLLFLIISGMCIGFSYTPLEILDKTVYLWVFLLENSFKLFFYLFYLQKTCHLAYFPTVSCNHALISLLSKCVNFLLMLVKFFWNFAVHDIFSNSALIPFDQKLDFFAKARKTSNHLNFRCSSKSSALCTQPFLFFTSS